MLDKEYVGTPGLWDIVVATTQDENIFTNGDYDNYAEIMHSKDALTITKVKLNRKPTEAGNASTY